jgi:hypothetical protein
LRIAAPDRDEDPYFVRRISLILASLALIGAIAVLTLVFLGNQVSMRTGPLCPAPNAVQVCATPLPTHDTPSFCGDSGPHTLPPTCRGG